MFIRLTLQASVLVALVLPTSPAQEAPVTVKVRAVVVPPLPFSVDEAEVFADRVVVKFREGIRVRLVDGDLTSLEGVSLDSVVRVLGGNEVARLFTRPVEDLDRERVQAQRNVPVDEEPLSDLNNFYLVRTSGARETERLVNTLNTDPLIETAYAEPRPIPLVDIPPPTPNFESRQTYLDAAPAGLNYRSLQSIVGARFPDNQMAHLEGGWVLGHEDCDWLVSSSYLGSPPGSSYSSTTWTYHGNACVGIMAAGRNNYGMRGFGSDTKKFFLVSLSNGSANMVNITAAQSQPGDVWSSSFAFGVRGVHAPRDWPQADYAAVRSASAMGIHYTFGAGNTNTNLENTGIYGTRYLPSSASSGGYIIGATAPGATSKISFSNYGSHVIANAWGDGVATLGYGSLFNPNDPRQHYTADFGGTSAAGPQVAGVIAAYVGAVREQQGRILTVAEVKSALQATGTAVTGNIGKRPNLSQLLALHGLPDGMLVTAEGTVGGSFTYRVRGNVGELYAVLIAAGRGNTPFGANRPLLLDLTTTALLGSGVLAATTVSRTLPVPNLPAFMDTNFYLQTGIDRGGILHLTNSAALWIK